MWSTSSVETRGSCKYSLMSLVCSSSIFWGAAAAAGTGLEPFLAWAKAGAVAKAKAASALAAIVKPSFIDAVLSGDLMSDIAFQGLVSTAGKAPGSPRRRGDAEKTREKRESMRTPPLPIPQFSPRLSVSAVNPGLFCCSGQPFSSGRTQSPGDGRSERHRGGHRARVDGRGSGGRHHGYRLRPGRAAGW